MPWDSANIQDPVYGEMKPSPSSHYLHAFAPHWLPVIPYGAAVRALGQGLLVLPCLQSYSASLLRCPLPAMTVCLLCLFY